jgi:RHS repeat-associated protein
MSTVVASALTAAMLVLVLLPATASAEALCTDTWVGPSEGAWQTAGNWSTGEVPTSTSVACIGAGKTVNVSEGGNHAGVVQGAGTLVVKGAALEVSDALEASSVAHLTIVQGTLEGPAEVDVTGSFIGGGNGGYVSGTLSGAGKTVIEPGATAEIVNENFRIQERTLINEGSLTIPVHASVSGSEGASIVNRGTLTVTGNPGGYGVIGAESGGATLINTGTVRKIEGTEATPISWAIDNEGTVSASSGTLEFTRGGGTSGVEHTGTWSTTGGATIEFSFANYSLGATVPLSGSFEVYGSVVAAGKIEGASAHVLLKEGTLEVTGSSPSTISTLQDMNGNLDGPAQVDVTGSFIGGGNGGYVSGTLSGAGKTVIEPGATAEIVNESFHIVQRTLINEGSLSVPLHASVTGSEGARIVNRGTLTVNGEGRDDSLSTGTGGATLVNAGALQKTEGTNITYIEFAFENFGGVDAHTGRFEFTDAVATSRETEYGGAENPSAPGQIHASCGDPVSCATGNDTESQTDLSVGGRGVGLNLTRTYNSQAAAEGAKGAFGYGWTSSFSDHLAIEAESHKATLHQADGSTVPFIESGGTFVAPAWSQDKLAGSAEAGYTLTLPNEVQYKFQGSGGRLESVTDRYGNATTLTYNSEGRLEAITDPDGRKLTLAYNAEGLVESATDPMSHVVKYAYESGSLASVTLPGESSPRWQYKYNGSHELTEMIDGRGGKTINEYNGANQVVAQTDPAKHTLRFEYEPFQTKITNEATGAVTLEQFTSDDEPSSITHGYGTALATTQSFTYNEGGYLTSETNGNNETTKYGYDGEGNRTSMVDPDANETKWTYDSTHDVLTTTTPDGEATTIKRESDGNPETISRPTPGGTQTTSYKYDAHGDLTSVENPLKETWKYEYDAAGDRTGEVDPENDRRTWKYNEDSQEESTVSPRGHATGAKESSFTTTIERDAQGRPLKITDPLGHETKYTYDGNGNLETETDPEGDKTTYTYNADNQPVKVQEPNGTTTETEYDGAGQVVSQTDGNKHTTKYTRNVLEQVTEVTDPLGHKTTKEYDKAGNLTSLTDAEKRTTTYKYAPDNRLLEVSYSDGKTPTVKYEYNGDGERTKMIDGTGENTYIYDKLNRLTESKDGHGDTTGYEYNLGNQQTKITYPNGKAVIRAYDNDGRLKSVTDWLEHTTKFAYNPDSELATTTFPSGTTDEDSYAYNDSDAMSEVAMKKGTETLASLVYARDKDERITKITTKGLPGEAKPAFSYDENSRLTKGTGTNYGYDPANNVTSIEKDSYSYNAADELEKSALKKTTLATYAYNEIGQRTKTTPASGPATTYGYDQAGNLTSVSRPKEGEAPLIEDSYTYNGEALRTSQTISGTTSYLAWDLAEELPLLLNDGSNSYIYGPAGLPIEQISSGGGAVYLHHDQQGSTRLITGSTGAVEGKCSYGAYGTPSCEGTATTALGYDAQYTSADTGLIYLRAREYDPATAQFLSVDPLVGLTGQRYAYADDDPTTLADPSGLLFGIPGTPSTSEIAGAVGSALSNPYRDAEYAAAGVCVVASAGTCIGAAAAAFAANTYNNAVTSSSVADFAGKEAFTVGETALGGAPGYLTVVPDALGAFSYEAADGTMVGLLPESWLGKTALNLPPGAAASAVTALEPAAEAFLFCSD